MACVASDLVQRFLSDCAQPSPKPIGTHWRFRSGAAQSLRLSRHESNSWNNDFACGHHLRHARTLTTVGSSRRRNMLKRTSQPSVLPAATSKEVVASSVWWNGANTYLRHGIPFFWERAVAASCRVISADTLREFKRSGQNSLSSRGFGGRGRIKTLSRRGLVRICGCPWVFVCHGPSPSAFPIHGASTWLALATWLVSRARQLHAFRIR